MPVIDGHGTRLCMDIPGKDTVVLPGHGVENQLKQIDEKLLELQELRRIAESAELRAETAIKEAEDTRRMADAAHTQAMRAEKDAESARKKAFWASLRSWISIAIAAISCAVSLLTYLEKTGIL